MSPFLTFFLTPHFWLFFIEDISQESILQEHYLFMFRRLQNNITCFSCKKNFYKQHQAEISFEIMLTSGIKRSQKKTLLSKEHSCYKIHALLMKIGA